MKIISFGEVLFDIIEGSPHLGGAPLNFAAHLAQCGMESYILSRVGADKLGDQAADMIKEMGVETTFLQRDRSHPTGTVHVVLSQGEPDYTIEENVAYDFIDADGKQDLLAMDFDVLYFGSLVQRHTHSANTLRWLTGQKEFRHIFYDVNLRKNGYTRDIIQSSLRLCTILKLNMTEAEVLQEMFYPGQDLQEPFLRSLTDDYDINTVIITAGGKGCYTYHQGRFSFIKGHAVKVVDTIGAGDSFSAAFVYHYLKHKDVFRAAGVANRVGAFVAGRRGAIPVYPPEIKFLLGV